MLSSHSIQLIFSSWDVIKNIPDYQQMFSDQLSEKLSDSTVAEWFSGPANPHHMVFVKMIDLIVHLLGPDLDVIIEELTAQGRRHHRYHSDMIGFFHVDSFAQIADAFIEIVGTTIEEQAAKESREIRVESVLHPSQMEAVTKSWSEIFTMIRAIMKQGVKMEVRRHKKRAEIHRQEILAKLNEGSDATASETDCSETESLSSDSCTPITTLRKSRLSPTRGVGRAVSSTLGNMVRTAPNRTKSGVRAGLAMLGTAGSGKKSSKLSKMPRNRSSMGNLRKGLRSSMSMKRMVA